MRNAGLGEKDSLRVTRKKGHRGNSVEGKRERKRERVNMAAQANDRRRTQEL